MRRRATGERTGLARLRHRFRRAGAVVAAVFVLAALSSAAQAAGGPFGVGTPDAAAPAGGDGIAGWIAAWQSTFYRELTAALRELGASPRAGWLLVGLSFLYGVFHAIGPGHGKAVITSYLLATGETLRRGIAISFASALLQAASAITIVLVFTILIGATAMTMGRVTGIIEIASYGMIAALGAALLWRKAVRPALAFAPFAAAHAHAQPHAHSHSHEHPHMHAHSHAHDHHDHAHHHGHGGHCGHAHAPDPALLGGRFDWRKAAAAATAVGIRPCSGALIVLVFALSQGIFVAGIAATIVMALGTGLAVSVLAAVAVFARGAAVRLMEGGSPLLPRFILGVEIAASLVIFLFGALMLSGALAAGGYL